MNKNKSSQAAEKLKCWVPICSTAGGDKKLFSLPENPQARETWLALAGKPITSLEEKILFCAEHFSPTEILKIRNSYYINSLPHKNMPEKICRLCMSIISSEEGSNDFVHILSSTIKTDMPSCIEELLSYFVPSDAEPLLKLMSVCLPAIDIQCNPPSLICDSCFENIWLFYMYKMSANQVERTLRENLPIENYSKMVLCRSCPIRFGTTFNVIAGDSLKGQLLKEIFKETITSQHANLPLRLCKKCFNVIEKLEVFYKTIQVAEEMIKRQIEMEREHAQRRNTFKEFRKMMNNRNQEISTLLRNYRPDGESIQSSLSDSANLSKCYSVGSEQNKISLSQFTKESLAKVILKHGQNLKNENGGAGTIETWTIIRDNMLKCDIKCEITELTTIWKQIVDDVKKKLQTKQPLDYLDELVSLYLKGDINPSHIPDPVVGFNRLKESQKQESKPGTSRNSISNTKASINNTRASINNTKSSVNKTRASTSSTRAAPSITRASTSSPSASTDNTDSTPRAFSGISKRQPVFDDQPPLLTPEVPVKVKEKFWNEETEQHFLTLFEQEAEILQKTLDPAKRLSWNQVLKEVHEKHSLFQHISVPSLNCHLGDIRKKYQTPPYEHSAQRLILNRLDKYVGNPKNKKYRMPEDDLEFLEFIEREIRLFVEWKKRTEVDYRPSVAQIVMKIHKKYQPTITKMSFLNKIYKLRQKVLKENRKSGTMLKELALLNRIDTMTVVRSNCKRIPPLILSKTKVGAGKRIKYKQKLLKKPRRQYTLQEQLALIREMTTELEIYKKNPFRNKKTPWLEILRRIEKRKFLGLTLVQLQTMWSKMRTSARTHSKDSDDIVDTETWRLLQSYIKIKAAEKEKSNKSGEIQRNDAIGSKNVIKTENKTTTDTGIPKKNTEDDKNKIIDTVKKDTGEGGKDGDSKKSTQGGRKSSVSSKKQADSFSDDDDVGDSPMDEGTDDTKEYDGSESGNEDDKFEENSKPEKKVTVKTEKSQPSTSQPSTSQASTSKYIPQFDKLKFFKGVKRELKLMYENRERGLSKPFRKICERLVEKEFSKWRPEELHNTWRTSKTTAIDHLKKGILSDLDRAVLEITEYKKDREKYMRNVDSDSDHDKDQVQMSWSDDEDEHDIKRYTVNELLLNDKIFLGCLKKELRLLLKSEPNKTSPFQTILQKYCRNYKEYCLLKEKWQKMRDVALANQKEKKLNDDNRKVLQMLLYSRSERNPKADNSNGDSNGDTDLGNVECIPKIIRIDLLRAMNQECNELIKEPYLYDNLLDEALRRVRKKEYRAYSFDKVYREWKNATQNAYKRKNLGTMNEEDKLFFKMRHTAKQYKNSKTNDDDKAFSAKIPKTNDSEKKPESKEKALAKPSCSTTKENDLTKPSCSKEENNSKTDDETAKKIPLKRGRKSLYTDDDLLVLFKLIKKEYLNFHKLKIPIPTQPWTIVTKKIAETKSFKCTDEKELNRLWFKMRKNVTLHENTNEMTPLDWKVVALLNRHKRALGQPIKEKSPPVPKPRPRPTINAGSESDDSSGSSKNKEEARNKLKLDLLKVMRKLGKVAFAMSGKTPSPYYAIEKEMRNLGYTYSHRKLRGIWNYMILQSKRAMANVKPPTEVESKVIDFMTEVMKTTNDMTDREECLREDLKMEPMSDDEGEQEDGQDGDDERSSSRDTPMDYQHISLKDIEAQDTETPHMSIKSEAINIKQDHYSDNSSDSTTTEYISHEDLVETSNPFSNVKIEVHNNENQDKTVETRVAEAKDPVEVVDLCSDLDDLLPDVDEQLISNLQ